MAEHYDIVVLGGGLVGLATAAALRAEVGPELAIAVFDAGPPLAPVSTDITGLRVSALAPASIALLQRLGVWRAVEDAAQTYTKMQVWSADDGPDAASAVYFRADELGVPALGAIAENDRVRAALAAHLSEHDVAVHFLASATTFSRSADRVDVQFATHPAIRTRLLVGADGARSKVRRWLRIPSTSKRYPQDALVCHVSSERPHDRTAWQQFNADGPMALLPLADGRASVVYSTTPQRAAELRSLDDKALGAALSEASSFVLGALTPASARVTFPLGAAQAKQYAVDRAVLIGDAAHRVHPLAGQGANLGVADGIALAKNVAASVNAGRDLGDYSQLRSFADARRAEARQMVLGLDLIHRSFATDATAWQQLRSTGMRWFNASTFAKRTAARLAMGLAPRSDG